MNDFKKDMIKRELATATPEELDEIFESVRYSVNSETFNKFLDKLIEEKIQRQKEYDDAVRAEVIKHTYLG